MVQNQRTPSQHNSILYISPLIDRRCHDIFATPPNPSATTFQTPGNNQSLFLNLELQSLLENRQTNELEPLTQAEKLRLWRHDAFMQHHYNTAEFIGDKVLALTDDPIDAFWLAQVYVSSGNYLRAKNLLTRKPEYERSVSCRYLAAYSLFKLELYDDALDLIGETNPFKKEDLDQVKSSDGGIKLEASMCYLRGLIFANQNNFDKAKASYKEAVLVDVKCFEAFNELISNNLMTPSEEWEFMSSLNYRDDNDELIKLLYTTRLSKYLHTSKFEEAEQVLKEEYDLSNNNDLLLSRADYLYVQCNFDECLAIYEKILSKDPFNFNVLPNYLSCLHELGAKNKLFLQAHQLAENHPTSPMTWLAIGIYYLTINKVVEARKFFSKATLLNPNFGHAWIGFAHTFAAEGEHEQAISAYAFAARLFPGTHLPNLFLGMQHLQVNNLNLAEEYLMVAYHICNTDPLVLNELGVINFYKNNLMKAEIYFEEAFTAAKHLNSDSKIWVSIHANLGHVYRRSGHPYKAIECFEQVLRISNENDPNILSALGLIYLKLGKLYEAIDVLHDALAIAPSDSVAADLLKRALESNKVNSSYFLKNTGETLFNLNLPTLNYRNQAKKESDVFESGDPHAKYLTPLKKSSELNDRRSSTLQGGDSLEQKTDIQDDPKIIAEILKRGEQSSEEDDLGMDIESD